MRILIKNKYVIDFSAAVMFFTRLPINWSFFSDKAPDLTKAAWAFPLVGFLIGVFSGIAGDCLIYLGVPIFLSCVISISLSVLLTGAFHEDGLADTADGLGAGGSPERINKIILHTSLLFYKKSLDLVLQLYNLNLTLNHQLHIDFL